MAIVALSDAHPFDFVFVEAFGKCQCVLLPLPFDVQDAPFVVTTVGDGLVVEQVQCFVEILLGLLLLIDGVLVLREHLAHGFDVLVQADVFLRLAEQRAKKRVKRCVRG